MTLGPPIGEKSPASHVSDADDSVNVVFLSRPRPVEAQTSRAQLRPAALTLVRANC